MNVKQLRQLLKGQDDNMEVCLRANSEYTRVERLVSKPLEYIPSYYLRNFGPLPEGNPPVILVIY